MECAAGGGKSGARFLRSSGGRLLLKVVSRIEFDSFLADALPYFRHIARSFRKAAKPHAHAHSPYIDTAAGSDGGGGGGSMLVKILGAYTISKKRGLFGVGRPMLVLIERQREAIAGRQLAALVREIREVRERDGAVLWFIGANAREIDDSVPASRRLRLSDGPPARRLI